MKDYRDEAQDKDWERISELLHKTDCVPEAPDCRSAVMDRISKPRPVRRLAWAYGLALAALAIVAIGTRPLLMHTGGQTSRVAVVAPSKDAVPTPAIKTKTQPDEVALFDSAPRVDHHVNHARHEKPMIEKPVLMAMATAAEKPESIAVKSEAGSMDDKVANAKDVDNLHVSDAYTSTAAFAEPAKPVSGGNVLALSPNDIIINKNRGMAEENISDSLSVNRGIGVYRNTTAAAAFNYRALVGAQPTELDSRRYVFALSAENKGDVSGNYSRSRESGLSLKRWNPGSAGARIAAAPAERARRTVDATSYDAYADRLSVVAGTKATGGRYPYCDDPESRSMWISTDDKRPVAVAVVTRPSADISAADSYSYGYTNRNTATGETTECRVKKTSDSVEIYLESKPGPGEAPVKGSLNYESVPDTYTYLMPDAASDIASSRRST